jgi:hypothetical protein
LKSPWTQHSTALNLGHSMWNSADEYLRSFYHTTIRQIIGTPCCGISDQEWMHP